MVHYQLVRLTLRIIKYDSFSLNTDCGIPSSVSSNTMVYKGPWQSLLIDITRQHLFEARDKIFLYATDGKLDFNSETYNNIRNFLNNSIKIGHRIGIRSFLASYISDPDKKIFTDTHKNDCILSSIDNIEDLETRRKVKELIIQSTKSIMYLIAFRSVIALMIFISYISYAKFQGRYSQTLLTFDIL